MTGYGADYLRTANGDQYDDRCSSASDDDYNAVEVTFDASSPNRRKSSMIQSEAATAQFATSRSKPSATQCLVHQFLEGHRYDRPKRANRDHDNHKHEEITREVGLDEYVEPKGKAVSQLELPSTTEEDSDASNDRGQADEQVWRKAVKKGKAGVDHHQGLNSRLLTKKQLTDMAWGVRELSRRLGNIKLKFKARSIFLLTKAYDRELIPKTREIAKWLLSKDRDVRYTVYVEESLQSNKEFDAPGLLQELRQEYIDVGQTDSETPEGTLEGRLRYWAEKMCHVRPHTFDFVITLGGDGTVLYASWLFQRIVPPVLSFSLGSLGFLTKFDFNDYQDILSTAFRDGVTVSLRLRFEGTVMRSQKKKANQLDQIQSEDEKEAHRKRDLIEELIGGDRDDEHTHRPDGTYEILNEIVVDRGPNPTMSNIEIFGDDEHFTSVLADGVCVSTPTGSTAYNLATGGSLCHPENPVMLISSICAHTLSFRPIILPDTIVLRLGVPYNARTNSWASFDGRERIELFPGDYVTISASRFPFASVQPRGRRSEDWVKSISAKLGWNTRQKQKNEGYAKWGN
ncbi:ATP-NAD kinase [Daldinia caldariorum]|uniref:ATP-NAD kinase n=1 Tax=Daldinia caldariorum TaxID=326644 RepID=UPI00200885FA|nr:ATP-NAD kinase [Daldinia caldariorum]KAI1469767.1 ATP-NAD kinase [Daldinia caldariorum]